MELRPGSGPPPSSSFRQTGGYGLYQDFLALWKDADPDIPILKQAKAEYAKVQ